MEKKLEKKEVQKIECNKEKGRRNKETNNIHVYFLKKNSYLLLLFNKDKLSQIQKLINHKD